MVKAIPVPEFKKGQAAQTNVPSVRFSTAPGDVARTMENVFAGLGERTEQMLDRVAKDEGERAGRAAGLDPNYRPGADPTIRGRAFERAATQVYTSQLDMSLREDMERVYQDNKHDPKALERALDGLRLGYSSRLFPEMQADFEASFSRNRLAYSSDAARLAEIRTIDGAKAGALGELDGRRKTIERTAFMVGDDAVAAKALSGEISSYQHFLLEHGPKGEFEFGGKTYKADPARSGAFTLEGIESELQGIKDRAIEARVLGKFERIETPSARMKYLDEFEADYLDKKTGEFKENPSAGMSLKQVRSVAGKMRTEITRDQTAAKAGATRIRNDAKDYISMMGKGHDPGSAILDRLSARARSVGAEDVVADIQDARELLDFTKEARVLRPEQLQLAINTMRSEIADAEGVTPQTATKLDTAEKLLSTMNTEIERDPLSWAARVDLVDQTPIQLIDPEGQPGLSVSSMEARVASAETVSEYYGRAPRFLTDEEANQLSSGIDGLDTDGQLQIITNIADGFGEHATAVFEELNLKSPVVAHVGGLAVMGGDLGAVRDALAGYNALRIEGAVSLAPMATDISAWSNGVIGTAFQNNLETRSSVIQTAKGIYHTRAVRNGLTEPDEDIWNAALQEAAGARFAGDRQFGGIGEYRGYEVIVPSSLATDDFEDTIEEMTLADLALAGDGLPRHGDGSDFTLEDFQGAYLETVGDGRYVVNMQPADSGFQEYAIGNGPNGTYVLDLKEILPRLGLAPIVTPEEPQP